LFRRGTSCAAAQEAWTARGAQAGAGGDGLYRGAAHRRQRDRCAEHRSASQGALRGQRSSAQRRARPRTPGKKTAVTLGALIPPVAARDALRSSYEELRQIALASGDVHGRGTGMALLIRSGMARWMDACIA